MHSDLKSARLEEAKSLMALLVVGQELRRSLEACVASACLPEAERKRAVRALREHLAATKRYARASSARAIGRQRIDRPGQQRKCPAHMLAPAINTTEPACDA